MFRLDLSREGDSGKISILVLGDADHSSFDNLTFADTNTLLAAEDRGDGLQGQLNRLDSVWAYFLDGSAARRLVALGRDRPAELDAELAAAGTPGFQNDGDNEPTVCTSQQAALPLRACGERCRTWKIPAPSSPASTVRTCCGKL
jgi:hypothetical protein